MTPRVSVVQYAGETARRRGVLCCPMGKGSTKNANYDRESLLYRLHRARLIIVGIVLLSIGIVLTLTVHGKIAEDFASTLINMGTIGIFGDFAARVIAEARVVELF